jgi:transglutaminase-like putative cysteine protease
LIALTIHHKTTYRYNRPVSLNAHRLMLRPRESRELRLLSAHLTVMPEAVVTWAHDVFGNAVATATFQARPIHLVVDSVAELELDAIAWPVFDVAASAASTRFPTCRTTAPISVRWRSSNILIPWGGCASGPMAFVRSRPTDTLSLLKDLSAGITGWVRYQSREDEGTQSPSRRSTAAGARAATSPCCSSRPRAASASAPASCRDICTIRSAKRNRAPRMPGGGFRAGAGWITFDPTNRSVGGFNLIPVAVGRGIHQVTPVAGSFIGATDAFQGLWVDVSVTSKRRAVPLT